ncbi:MAG: DEAD/DEAH box helicase [Labilithrix sp.]|nr:DEAD/DEAH box helicase [Labilithrix sp.]
MNLPQAVSGSTPSGNDAPQPTFDAIPLSADVRKAIDALGYVNPTPVQLAVFEPATRGKSLVVQAQTGTGKTAAFGMPIIDTLIRKSMSQVQALILTPTRELALQVARELEQLAQFRGTKIIAIYGGAPMGRQIDALEQGAQVVVGTPGRVLDHLRRGTFDPSQVRIFVLDEADEMLSMGFAKELNAIIDHLPAGDRQGLYFSATIPPDVERLANRHLKEPEYVTLSSDQVGALKLAHYVYLVREGDKRSAILSIIEVEDPQSAVVFCNTKDETERVAELLKSRGFDADWLNGDLEQKERERVMQKTREGKLRFLVATDVAARGIDISHLTHVINADFPESAEQYVHRTGRTGRAGRTGTAISVVGPKDVGHLYMLRLTYKIRPIERMLPTKGELKTRAEADVVTFLADAYAGRAADPFHLAVARRLFTHDAAESIVAGLLADHLGANSTQDPAADAAEARRAKNPPPEPEPKREAAPRREPREGREARPRSTDGPRTLRDGERPAEGRRGRRRDLRDWQPPAEQDDDRPLLPETETSLDEAQTAVGLPDEAPRRRRDPRREEDDEATIDTDRHPRLPKLPGITEEGAAPPSAAGRSEGARPRDAGRPRREPRGRTRDDEAPTDPSLANIFLNVGRRDGVSPEALQRLLAESAGIPESETGNIRVRDRITFVTVRKELAERAIRALAGQVVGGRTVVAEPARDK